MELEFNSDQQLLVDALDRWVSDHLEIPVHEGGAACLPGYHLADDLAEYGYLNVADQAEFGALGAALLIEKVGLTPWSVEVGASALVAPMLGIRDIPRPVALLQDGRTSARFLTNGGTAIIDAGDHVRLLACDDRVKAVESVYPYPFGQFSGDPMEASVPLLGVEVEALRMWRGIAAVAEAVGAMEAALSLTLDYVTSRVQFGQTIGSFQAVQHRLAECSTMMHGVRLLLYRAAREPETHCMDAVVLAHQACKRITYETSQLHGAIGQTLEYPLHFWSYRLRVLQFDLFNAFPTRAHDFVEKSPAVEPHDTHKYCS